MPMWVQVILAAGAVVGSLGVIGARVIVPTFQLARAADDLVPLLRDFTEAFEGTPHVFAILDEIAREFRTNSGSSLRDVINRLERMAARQTVAIEAARQLSADDRRTLARAELVLGLLDDKSNQAASDAAASQARADATVDPEPGSAADAALRSAPAADPEERHP